MTRAEAIKAVENLQDFYIIYGGSMTLRNFKKNNCNFGEYGIDYPQQYCYARYDSIIYIGSEKPNVLEERHNDIGSDPEFFFVKDGVVVPSAEVIREKAERVIVDGFQGELNPRSSYCRQVAGNNLASAITEANRIAKKAGATISFEMSQIIPDSVWKRVPTALKRFGCNPTMNVHESRFIRKTGLRERFRSAGGHVHMTLTESMKKKTNELVRMLDIVCGNTCVLIDRDPNNARRRKIYGRAGEHRIKPYGVEYRVPSNFWLKHYVLWSMVSGLCRNAITLTANGHSENIIKLFDEKKVRRAINDNDYDLAMENFLILKKYFIDNKIYISSGLSYDNLDLFEKWARAKNPLAKLGTMDSESIVNRWVRLSAGNRHGFELFLKSSKNK